MEGKILKIPTQMPFPNYVIGVSVKIYIKIKYLQLEVKSISNCEKVTQGGNVGFSCILERLSSLLKQIR